MILSLTCLLVAWLVIGYLVTLLAIKFWLAGDASTYLICTLFWPIAFGVMLGVMVEHVLQFIFDKAEKCKWAGAIEWIYEAPFRRTRHKQ